MQRDDLSPTSPAPCFRGRPPPSPPPHSRHDSTTEPQSVTHSGSLCGLAQVSVAGQSVNTPCAGKVVTHGSLGVDLPPPVAVRVHGEPQQRPVRLVCNGAPHCACQAHAAVRPEHIKELHVLPVRGPSRGHCSHIHQDRPHLVAGRAGHSGPAALPWEGSRGSLRRATAEQPRAWTANDNSAFGRGSDRAITAGTRVCRECTSPAVISRLSAARELAVRNPGLVLTSASPREPCHGTCFTRTRGLRCA